MKMTVIQDIAVSPNLHKGTQSPLCAYPMSCQLSNRELLCIYRQGKEKHSLDGVLIAQRSTDGGAKWSEEIIIYDGMSKNEPESVLGNCYALCQTTDGTILALFATVEAKKPDVYILSEEGRKLRQQLYTVRSKDGGETWSIPEPHNLAGAPRNIYISGRPLLLPNGDLFIPMEATVELGQEIILASISSDGGLTFSPVITCAEDETGKFSYGDPGCTLLPNGRIIMLIWTWLSETEETLAVHRYISTDNGRS